MKRIIAVLNGDGIGPEIMAEGLKVLDAVGSKHDFNFDRIYAPFGASSYFNCGHPFPDSTKHTCYAADAILKGPVGLSREKMKEIPEGLSPEGAGLLPLRKMLDTYANLRPVVLPLEFADFSPLKKERLGDGIDILMIRELVGGNYFGNKVEGKNNGWQYAIDEGRYDHSQIERIATFAFKEAMKRNKVLTSVNKPNIMAEGRLWEHVVREVAEKYPEVKLNEVIVDNMACQLVLNPSQYNGVVLMDNMQGDILTDEAGGILGSLGLMPTACLNPETRKGYFEPAHGSAPDIAGQGIANPYSMIGSVALMLERSFGMNEEARDIWNALTGVFGEGFRTRDLGRKDTLEEKILTTSEFGDKVVAKILKG